MIITYRYVVTDAAQQEHTIIRIPIQGSITTGEAHVDALESISIEITHLHILIQLDTYRKYAMKNKLQFGKFKIFMWMYLVIFTIANASYVSLIYFIMITGQGLPSKRITIMEALASTKFSSNNNLLQRIMKRSS
jgi:hypothetical protein